MQKIITLILCLCLAFQAKTQHLIATLDVTPSPDVAVPVMVNLDAITALPDTMLYLTVAGQKAMYPFQIRDNGHRELHWIVLPGKKIARYRLMTGKGPGKSATSLTLSKSDGALRLQAQGRNLLQYNFETVYPPPGVDTIFKRSGFIHPLWSPHGQVLTRIQPPDHYHHYGIWNPWTQLLYKGDTLDLWNLYKKQGTVRFAKFIAQQSGPVFASYTALHEHVAFRKNNEEVILLETQSIRTYQPDQHNAYILDITVEYTCASPEPVLLLEYRYGGLGWRTTEQWTNTNSTVLTSEGKTRKDADGSKARWCLVQGAIDNTHAGVLMMSSPDNYNHPEPLRIWPENQYNRGDMFVNFDPTKDRDWLLEPGKVYVLHYRFVVFNGPFSRERSEESWQAFAHPPAITVKRHNEP